MSATQTNTLNREVYYRLIALWVLCEAMLGGIIHGFKIPVSGLIVGSCSVICIGLIAYYFPAKGNIIKATIVVAIFKMMLSPQAPPAAYIAVFFQGVVGELVFFNRRFFKLSCLLLALLSLAESAVQRIAVLTLVYGTDLWKAIDDLINKLTHEKQTVSYSIIFISVYIAIHLIVGLLIGIWLGLLPKKIAGWQTVYPVFKIEKAEESVTPNKVRRKKNIKTGILIVWSFLLIIYLQSVLKFGKPILPSHISLQIFIRSVLIILTWYLLLSPLLMQLLKNWLEKKKQRNQTTLTEILDLLPIMKQIIFRSWSLTENKKGLKRIFIFIRVVLINTLSPQ